MNKRTLSARVGDFLEGKGFYKVLFLCVAAIGISGYYLFSASQLSVGSETPVDGQAEVVLTPAPTPKVIPTPTPAATPAPTPAATPYAAPTPAAQAGQATASTALFVWPLKGDVVTAFSPETLAKNESMGDWRTHTGIDLSAALGTQVMAVSDGTVSSVLEDALLGTTVTIDHGNGLSSVYANLAAQPTVAAGDAVHAGDVIGSVGATAGSEAHLASHLHLALYQGEDPVDPAEYLPQ